MQVDAENIDNLTGLWSLYGYSELGVGQQSIAINNGWPNRVWLNHSGGGITGGFETAESFLAFIKQLPSRAILPLWQAKKFSQPQAFYERLLNEHGWVCSFKQTAMYKPLNLSATNNEDCLNLPHPGFELMEVQSVQELTLWVALASEAFDYIIDMASAEKLLHRNDVQVLIALQNGKAVATALLYQTGEFIGVHQVGVKKPVQGQGIAQKLMQEIIDLCTERGDKCLVLQASEVGFPLYKRLGFLARFKIENYKAI